MQFDICISKFILSKNVGISYQNEHPNASEKYFLRKICCYIR